VEIALHATPRPGTPGSVSVVVSGGGEIVARVTVQVDR
jgi:hypothetical protein